MLNNSVLQQSVAHQVFSEDFPDPFVLRIQSSNGSQYYAYATNAGSCNIQVLCASDGLSRWENLGDGMPELPAWASAKTELTWAPVVTERSGKYVMFYTARATDKHVQCISRAVAHHPAGPFIDNSMRPLICPVSQGGAIDPSPFIDIDGTVYLLWKNDGNSRKMHTSIWIQALSEDGLSLVGKPVRLIREDQGWEYPLVEGPSMVLHEGKYYLFYSANDYKGEHYAVGYAVSDSPFGPFVKPLNHAWFSSWGLIRGPGGQEFFTDDSGALWMAYHAWTLPYVGYPKGKRSLFIERVLFIDGEPKLECMLDPTFPSLS